MFDVMRAGLVAVSAELRSAHLVGDKQFVMPPTYAGAKGAVHNHTPVRADGTCEQIVVDSPQSMANRIEEKLRGVAAIPRIEVRVGERTLDTLSVPHRVFDAILRDSEDAQGIAFRATDAGKAITQAATLARVSPNVLLFGGWDSHGAEGSAGSKFPSAMTVQVVGTNAVLLQDAESRIDPLAITLDAAQIYETEDGGWTLDEAQAKRVDGEPVTKRPSEKGHGNIKPTLTPKGALVDRIVLTGAISVTRLRRYLDRGVTPQQVEALVAMGVAGLMDVLADGLDLRSGCELYADNVEWSVAAGVGTPQKVAITRDAAAAWRDKALAAAGYGGNVLAPLTASAKLLQLLAGVAAPAPKKGKTARSKSA